MDLLVSNENPVFNDYKRSFRPVFWDLWNSAKNITIAVAYIGQEAVDELKAELKPGMKLDLIIGQNYQEGIYPRQLIALRALDKHLNETGSGSVYVFVPGPFHGKIYRFQGGELDKSIIGSSNLPNISIGHNNIEVDLCVTTPAELDDILSMLHKSSRKLSDLSDAQIAVKVPTEHLDGSEKIARLDAVMAEGIRKSRTDLKFDIVLKTEPMSNLNVFNGQGRKGKDGTYKRRAWYEVEVIVPKEITSLDGYPGGKEFFVLTDDGFFFPCTCSGTNFKNLRSTLDLHVLGRWIKGKLVAHGCLAEGELVSDDTFNKYRNRTLVLCKTEEIFAGKEVWTLEYHFEGTYDPT